MLSDRDKKILLKLKEKIITKCLKCKGKNPSCSCVSDFRLEFKKVKANIPSRYRSSTLDQITHPQTVEARAKLKDYVSKLDLHKENGMGLFIYGSTGLAKTSQASAILSEALKKNCTGYFTTLDKCVSLYTGGWRDENLKEQFEELILSTDFLVLDEVGNESRLNIQLVKNCFNDVIRQRSNNLLVTIVTSNLYFSKIKEVYGDEVYSILHESCIPVEFKGIDFRQGISQVGE